MPGGEFMNSNAEMEDEFDMDLPEEEPVQLNESLANAIVVDNVPVVAPERLDRLRNAIGKLFSVAGQIVDLQIPLRDTDGRKQTAGYAFIEYTMDFEAQNAISRLNNHPFDKRHILKVNSFEDFERFRHLPDTYEEPKEPEIQPMDELRWWIPDPRDQFVVRHANETEIVWSDNSTCYDGSVHKRDGKTWTQLIVHWSPRGSFLATFHLQGIVLWGGPNWTEMARFQHPGVKNISFSPNEHFMISWHGVSDDHKSEINSENTIIWDVRCGEKMKSFNCPGNKWPPFKWSHDGTYFARADNDHIHVYETSTMRLLDRKPMHFPGVKDFDWSPHENLMSLFTPESDNIPAKVTVVHIPSRQQKREQHLFNVISCQMYWQNRGDFLAAKVERHSKSKKSVYTTLEIFQLHNKKKNDIPVEVIEIPGSIIEFTWEPRGSRFAIIHGENPSRPNVAFYKVSPKQIKLLHTLENKLANRLFWSPLGGQMVIAGLGSNFGSSLEFWNINDFEMVAQDEHLMVNEITWSPSGRFVITAVSQPLTASGPYRYTLENGYHIWTMQGKLLHRQSRDKLYQVMWRPRPQSLVTEEQMRDIRAHLKERFSRRYEEEDTAEERAKLEAVRKERAKLRQDFMKYRQEREQEYAEQKPLRRELRGGYDSDDDDEYEIIEEVIEEQINVREEVMP